MFKLFALLACLLFHASGHSAWVYFDDGNGSTDDYYDSAISPQGKTTTIKTFTAHAIVNRVPFYDPKIKGKVTQLVRVRLQRKNGATQEPGVLCRPRGQVGDHLLQELRPGDWQRQLGLREAVSEKNHLLRPNPKSQTDVPGLQVRRCVFEGWH